MVSKITKLIKYSRSLLRQFIFNAGNFDIRYAHWNLWESIASVFHMKKTAARMSSNKRKYVLHYLDDIAKSSVHENIGKKEIGETPKIWMFWWTGLESAPDIVRISVNSVRANANGFEVCVLDRDNYLDYLSLPTYIIEKHDQGIITHAMFSDILRMTLLSLYGGIWIDATMICLRPLPEMLKEIEFYTCRTYEKDSPHISKSRWTSFFMAGSPEFRLFTEAREILFNYWRLNDAQIDYLLIDYTLEYIRIKDPEIRKVMDALPDNNLKRNQLYDIINDPYSEELLQEFMDDETFIYKCSWRYKDMVEIDREGKRTIFGFLKDRYLSKD